MTRRRSLLVLLSLMLVLGLVETVRGVTAQASKPILIGAPVHLTGFMATYDVPPLEGARLAVKQINEAGGVMGRQLQLIEADGKSDPATLSTAAREVIEQGAEVLVTPCDFEMGAPAGQVAQEAGLVGISFCASSPLYGSEELGDKQFTLSMWNQTMAAAAAEFAYTDKGWKTAATIVDQVGEYSKSLGEFFAETFTHLGGKVISEDTYLYNDMQAADQAQRIKELDPQPDVIFISSSMPDYAAIIRDVRAAGVTAPIMGGDSMDTGDFYTALGPELGHDIFWGGTGQSPRRHGVRSAQWQARLERRRQRPLSGQGGVHYRGQGQQADLRQAHQAELDACGLVGLRHPASSMGCSTFGQGEDTAQRPSGQ